MRSLFFYNNCIFLLNFSLPDFFFIFLGNLLFSYLRKGTRSVIRICTILRRQQLPDKMTQFNVLLCFVFALGLLSSTSMAAPAPAPVATAPKASPAKSPASPSPVSPPPATVSSPAHAPSKVATPPSSASSPTAKTPASSPSTQGPATVFPPSASSGAVSTARLKNMAIFGAALLGGAAFLL